jgi:hypothetical protein
LHSSSHREQIAAVPATDVEAAAAAVTTAKDCLLATAAAATEIEARRC